MVRRVWTLAMQLPIGMVMMRVENRGRVDPAQHCYDPKFSIGTRSRLPTGRAARLPDMTIG